MTERARRRADEGAPGEADQSQKYEAFVGEVKFVLMTAYRTPERVADELLRADANFLRGSWEKEQEKPGSISVLDVAAEISLEPGEDTLPHERGEHMVVLKLRPAVRGFLEALVERGIHGDSIGAVAEAMVIRGIESAAALVPGAGRSRS